MLKLESPELTLCQGPNLTVAVLNGTVPQWRLDDMAVRVVAAWYYVDRPTNRLEDGPNFSSWSQDTFGFQHAYAEEAYTRINDHVDVRNDHVQAIRKVATDGTVLLKNNGALPLTGHEKLTTVFGADASENPWGPNGCNDRGCNNGTYAMGWGSGTGKSCITLVLARLKQELTLAKPISRTSLRPLRLSSSRF